MATFSVTPLGPATLSALSAIKPAQAVLINVVQDRKDSAATTLSTQDLAQEAFQQALQTATLSPLASANTGTSSLAAQATASLLAALNPPQAAAASTAVPDGTTNPVAPGAAAQDSTAPTATPAAALATEVPAATDAFATGSSLDFALQTALRFGAGVAGQVAPATQGPLTEPGMVRDATAVLRTAALQAQTGHAGPEAFAQPQVPVQRAMKTYHPMPPAPSPGSLDLLA